MTAQMPHSSPDSSPQTDLDPISPEEAQVILDEAIQPYVEAGWFVMDRSAYAARLTKGLYNLDVRVDLLGQVETTQSGLTPLQDSGRMAAWVLLLASLLVALVISSILGII